MEISSVGLTSLGAYPGGPGATIFPVMFRLHPFLWRWESQSERERVLDLPALSYMEHQLAPGAPFLQCLPSPLR
jgi:hypothetical protein